MEISVNLVRVILAAFLGLVSSAALAIPITTPVDLNGGSEYRLAFITVGTEQAFSSDISFYNSFVSQAANAVSELDALNTNWSAIVSTNTVDARDNTSTNPFVDGIGVPVYLLNGITRIANDNSDLWDGSLLATLNLSQNTTRVNADVWTGTDTDGTALLALGTSTPTFGLSDFTFRPPSVWVDFDSGGASASRTIYAISDVLTVPGTAVPEPGTFALLGIGLASLVIARRRRKAS